MQLLKLSTLLWLAKVCVRRGFQGAVTVNGDESCVPSPNRDRLPLISFVLCSCFELHKSVCDLVQCNQSAFGWDTALYKFLLIFIIIVIVIGAKGGSTGQAHDHDNFHDNNSSRIVCSCGCCCHQLTQSLSTLWHVCHTHPVQSNETKDWNRGWWTHTYPALILHSFCSHPALILQCAGNAQLWDDRMSVCDTLTTLSDVLLKQK